MSEWIEVFDYNYIYQDGYYIYDLISKRIVNTKKIKEIHSFEQDKDVEIYKDGEKRNSEWFYKIYMDDGSSCIIPRREFDHLTQDCIRIWEWCMDEEVIKC